MITGMNTVEIAMDYVLIEVQIFSLVIAENIQRQSFAYIMIMRAFK